MVLTKVIIGGWIGKRARTVSRGPITGVEGKPVQFRWYHHVGGFFLLIYMLAYIYGGMAINAVWSLIVRINYQLRKKS